MPEKLKLNAKISKTLKQIKNFKNTLKIYILIWLALQHVSAQFLHLQILTFDKSLIPTLTHSCMEITSLPLIPTVFLPPYNFTIKTNMDRTRNDFRYSRVILRQPRQTTSITKRH